MSLSYDGNTSLTVTIGSQNKTQPDERIEFTVRASDSNQACENISGPGSFTHSLSGLSSNTDYTVSAVSCNSLTGNCSAPIVKSMKTFPARKYIEDILFAPN